MPPADGTGAGAQAPSLRRRAVSGAAWISVEMVSVQALSLLVFAVLAHFLDPHGFGLAAICLVMVNGSKVVLFDNVATIVSRKSAGTDREYATAFWITVAIAAAACAGLLLFSLVADQAFGVPGLGTVLRAMSAILLVQGLARTQEVWLQRHFLYRTLAIRSICGAAAGGAAGVAAARAGWGVWAIVLQQVVTVGGGFLLLWSTCPWRPGLSFSRATAREIGAFYWTTGGGNLAYAFNQNCDTLLIGLFFGASSAGIYNVAKRLRLALQLTAATPVGGVAVPALAEVQHDGARFLQVLLTATSVVFSLCSPLFLGAAAIGPDVIALLFGSRWVAAAPVFGWLAVGGLLALVVDYNNSVFLIRDRPGWTLSLAALNVAATLVGFVLCSRFWSGAPLALPFVLPYALTLPVSMLLLRRNTGMALRPWLRAVLPPLLASAAMVAAIRLAAPELSGLPVALRLAATVGGGGLIYLLALSLLSRSLLRNALSLLRGRRAALS